MHIHTHQSRSVCVCVCVFCWYPVSATWSSADPCITPDARAAFLLNQLACAGGLMGFRGNREHLRMAFFTPAPPTPYRSIPASMLLSLGGLIYTYITHIYIIIPTHVCIHTGLCGSGTPTDHSCALQHTCSYNKKTISRLCFQKGGGHMILPACQHPNV